jgi:uncharacterized protein with NRDE domain|tara:strand:+ start:9767 stop:10534 length:768 start_codon:yes stop_codon:yes gene_type:complete
MCLLLLKHQPNEQYKLVLLANRDEYHHRLAAQADFWPDHPSIFGGIDLLAGGSWLSVDLTGRLAAITNIRKPPFSRTNKRSRGHLVSDFLTAQQPAAEFLSDLKKKDGLYGLFNLILLDKTGLWHYSNDTHQASPISPGFHGLCNAGLNTPWPKLTQASTQFKQSLKTESIDPIPLLSIMQSQTKPPDALLPNTGIGLDFERFLSSVFIQGDEYGTRCTTLLTIDDKHAMQFIELSYDQQGNINAEVMQEIQLLH